MKKISPETFKAANSISIKAETKAAFFKQRLLKEYQNKRKLFGTVELKSHEQHK